MPITITDFKNWAAQNQGTAVAVDTGTQTLVNASTKIGVFDRIFRRGAVKAVRGAAIADFTRALSVRYGTSIARDALAAAGLSSTSKLTGQKIMAAVASAKQIRSRLLSQSSGVNLKVGTQSITQAQITGLGVDGRKAVKHFLNLRTVVVDMLGETPLSAADYQDFRARAADVVARLAAFPNYISGLPANSLPGGMGAAFIQEVNALQQALQNKDAQTGALLANSPLSPNNVQHFKDVWRDAVLNALAALGTTTTDQNTITAINAAISKINANPQAFNQRIPLTKKAVKELTPVVADCIKEQLKLLHLKGVKFSDSLISKKISAGYRQALNTRPWPIIDKTIAVAVGGRPDELRSTIIPAAQLGRAPGAQNGVISYPAGVNGYMCHSADTDHAVNLAVSSLTVQGPAGTELAFRGVRHAVHSAWEIPTAPGRATANIHRAEEAVIAAFMAKYNLPGNPQPLPPPDASGTINVPLNMVSVSLLTPDTMRHTFSKGSAEDERSMLIDQTQAWNSVAQHGVMFQYQGHQIRITPQIHTFNFGVNSGAVNHSSIMPNVFGGWDLSDSMNTAAMAAFRQDVTAFINNPNQPAAKRTAAQTLLAQCDQVLNVKGERKDSHDAYKMAARIAVLANLIGDVPCWNCKSGKDRTGEMDVECKFLSTLIARGEDIPAPGAPLTKDQQSLFRAIALEGGNFEVQKANTGFEGFKTGGVDSIPERLGGKQFREFHAGGSKYVGV